MTPIDLTISRHFAAPPDRVFALWADADHRRRWWAPEGFDCAEFTHEFQAGGAWQCRLVGTDTGRALWMGGTYQDIAAPLRLAFTFCWLDEGVTPGDRSLITVTFTPDGDGTRLSFHQSAFETAPARDAHQTGWAEVLQRLEHVVTA